MATDSNRSKLNRTFTFCVEVIKTKRSLIGFWIFGMTSNLAFSVSLSAAQDILDESRDMISEDTMNNLSFTNNTQVNVSGKLIKGLDLAKDRLVCNKIGTGVILLAATVPELVVKLLLQFSCVSISYVLKLIMSAVSMIGSFLTLAFGNQIWIRVLGVILASNSIGIGEMTFLPLASFYKQDVLTAWSSGTGASALIGSLSYAGLTSLGMATCTYMLIVLFVPILMVATYAFILGPRENDNLNDDCAKSDIDNNENSLINKEGAIEVEAETLTLKRKMELIPSLFRYIVPLTFVYFGVYFINQGLFELLYFNNQWLSRSEQYRWFNAIYRFGTFLSRSAKFAKVRRVWIPVVLLFVIMAAFICQLFTRFIPYLWIMMVLIFIEGIISGVAYISTFFVITDDLDPKTTEFALGLVTIAGPVGISLSGVTSIPVHNFICSLDLKL